MLADIHFCKWGAFKTIQVAGIFLILRFYFKFAFFFPPVTSVLLYFLLMRKVLLTWRGFVICQSRCLWLLYYSHLVFPLFRSGFHFFPIIFIRLKPLAKQLEHSVWGAEQLLSAVGLKRTLRSGPESFKSYPIADVH